MIEMFDLNGLTEDGLKLQRMARGIMLLDTELERKLEELRLAKAVATLNTINADQTQRQEMANLANDIYHQRHYFTADIDAKSVKDVIGLCTFWSNTNPGSDIQIIFNCQGGQLFFGMMLFDFITELKARGHKVIIGTYGLAASMAGILLQAASPGERYVGAESWMLIHEVSAGAQGSATKLRNEADFAKEVCARVRNIFLRNQALAIKAETATEAMTEAGFDARWKNDDWWLSSEDMIRLGFADHVGFPVFNAPVKV